MLPTIDAIADAIGTGTIPLHIAIELDDNIAAIWSAEQAPRALIRLIRRTCPDEVIIHRVVMPVIRQCVMAAGGPVEREILAHLEAALTDPETGLAAVAEDRHRLARLTAADVNFELIRFLQLVVTLVCRFLHTGGILDIVTLLPSRSMAGGMAADHLIAVLRSVGPPTLAEIVTAAENVKAWR